MLELKTKFDLVFDQDGYLIDPQVHDTQMIDLRVTKNAEDFGVVIKFQTVEEDIFFLSLEGCICLNIKKLIHHNVVSNIIVHSTEELLDDEELVSSDFDLEYPETKVATQNWIKNSSINRILITPDSGAKIKIYYKNISGFK